MLNLPVVTWVRFLIWMALGLILYFAYGMRRAKLSVSRGQAAEVETTST
jgi:basic amino acid/polyamine antiporter, APA family